MMKYDEFVVKIQKGQFDPVYFFVGEEDFLKEEAIRSLTAALTDPNTKDFNYDLLYGGETDAATALDIAFSFPMMSERRLVILRNIQNCSQKDRKALLHYVAKPVETTCLILVGPKVDLRKGFYKDMSKAASTVVFWPLFDNQIPAWIRRRLHQYNKSIRPEGLRLLQNLVGSNLDDLANELDKLIIYTAERDMIEREDVEMLVGLTKTHSTYDLAESVAEKKLSDSLQILDSLLEARESEVGIVWLLTRHFSTLVKVHELNAKGGSAEEIARKTKIRQSLIRSYLKHIQLLTPIQFERAFQLLLEADTNLKSGYQNPRLIMELLIYRLCCLHQE